MTPELGHFALVLSLAMALLMTLLPLLGVQTGNRLWMSSCRPLATGYFVFVALAFVCLSLAFWQDDFTVKYVANQSNSLLPSYYKLSAVWGGHEGSLLLWVLMLAGWTLAVAACSRNLPLDMLARVLAVMGMISVGFLLFILLTSNPFERLLPFSPAEGSDLNPLLQDIGLIIHPPVLYMGYVGFSVAFAFAIAALMSGRLDSAWARWSRPWTNTAWAFLGLGIALGSWWAYYELGWGGWWFWDPVENASFMPWLVGTALIHSLAATEKRGVFKSWTILLAIFAFSLSLLGTFLVRSGVLTSVHAFANDPERGVFILAFLALVVGGSLTLYALRAPVVKSVARFELLSRETALLGNNLLLIVAMATVLLGTLYPLIADALGWGKISVGPPYFNFFFVPLMGLLALLLGVGPITNWKSARWPALARRLRSPLVISLLAGLLFPLIYSQIDSSHGYSISAAIAVALGGWVISSTLADLLTKLKSGAAKGVGRNWRQGLQKLSHSYWGMVLAHLGVAITLMGVSLNTIYSEQRDLRMEAGKAVTLGGFEFKLADIRQVIGPNYKATEGHIVISRDGQLVSQLRPQKRNYFSGGNTMTEAAIDAGFWRDLYVALGEPMDKDNLDGAWAVRIHFKPFVRWIWLGAIFMALGACWALLDKRYARARRRELEQAPPAQQSMV